MHRSVSPRDGTNIIGGLATAPAATRPCSGTGSTGNESAITSVVHVTVQLDMNGSLDMLRYRTRIAEWLALMIGVFLLIPGFGLLQPARAEAISGESGLIAFVREGSEGGIYTIDRSGSELRRLTDAQDYRPRWSPDGTKIVFQGFEGTGDRSHIYVMDADGSNLQRLTTRPGFQPDWSPTGLASCSEASTGTTGRSS